MGLYFIRNGPCSRNNSNDNIPQRESTILPTPLSTNSPDNMITEKQNRTEIISSNDSRIIPKT
jgi:hypothetical protein